MADHTLSVHHVGGRGGDRRFPIIANFESGVTNVLYDGDADSAASVASGTQPLASRQIFLPICLADRRKNATLNVLKNPGGSSLLEFRSDFFDTFAAIGSIDFDLHASAFEVAHRIPVTASTLDECIEAQKAPPPDFLSLNTQGTELDIIRGAISTLSSHCVSLQTEISFYPLYSGQANLSDICDELARLGFWLTSIVPHTPYVPSIKGPNGRVSPPIGFRRGGLCLQADAIFFKDPRLIVERHEHPNLDLAKAVYVSLVLRNYGLSYCYAALADDAALPLDPAYLGFATAYIRAAKHEPLIPVPDYLDRFDSLARRKTSYFRDLSQDAFNRDSPCLLGEAYTATEQVCLDFGFREAAEHLREYRRAGMAEVCRLLD